MNIFELSEIWRKRKAWRSACPVTVRIYTYIPQVRYDKRRGARYAPRRTDIRQYTLDTTAGHLCTQPLQLG